MHLFEGAEFGEAEVTKATAALLDVGTEVLGLVGVAADGEDATAEVVVEAQDVGARLQVGQAVAEARGVEFDALAVGDHALEDGGHDVAGLLEGVFAGRVIAADEVEVAEDGVVLEGLDDLQQLLVVGAVVLVLRAAALEVARPKLEVAHLVDGADDEVELVLPRLEEGVVLLNPVTLRAQLEARPDGQLARELLAHLVDLGEVGRVVDVGDCNPVHHGRARGVAAVLLHVGLDAVVHVVGEAQLLDAELHRIGADVLHRVDGVVGELAVHVVVSKHVKPFLPKRARNGFAPHLSVGRTSCPTPRARCLWRASSKGATPMHGRRKSAAKTREELTPLPLTHRVLTPWRPKSSR